MFWHPLITGPPPNSVGTQLTDDFEGAEFS